MTTFGGSAETSDPQITQRTQIERKDRRASRSTVSPPVFFLASNLCPLCNLWIDSASRPGRAHRLDGVQREQLPADVHLADEADERAGPAVLLAGQRQHHRPLGAVAGL